jgi:hypothetical protein
MLTGVAANSYRALIVLIFLRIFLFLAFCCWYSLSVQAIIVEDLEAIASLNRSKALVKNNFLKILSMVMIVPFVTYLVWCLSMIILEGYFWPPAIINCFLYIINAATCLVILPAIYMNCNYIE